jgi:hypothetical protein
MKFGSPESRIENITPVRNTLIKTFHVDHLDLEEDQPDFIMQNNITPVKERALGTTAFGIMADDISRIQGTDGKEGEGA